MNILALTCALILLFSTLRGMRRGFLGALFSVISFILSIVFTAAVTPSLYHYMSSSEVMSSFFNERALSVIDGGLPSAHEGASASAALDFSSPESFMNSLGSLALSGSGVRDVLAAKIAGVMMGILAFLISWILISIILGVVSHVLFGLLRRRRLRTIDHALGLPVGLLKGLIMDWIILGVCSLLALTPIGVTLGREISGSAFLTALARMNPLSASLTSVVGSLI